MLIYRSGERRPRSIEDLYGRRIAVATGSSHAETLALLRRQHPDLTWLEHPTADQEELLERVSNGELDFTVTDSSAFRVSRYFYPEVRKAFELTEPQPLAWALKDGLDDSLREAVARYFDTGDSARLMADIDERYFSRPVEFDYVGARTFLSHVDTRLTRYKSMFQQAAAEIGMDWRLLAAVGYQESHWNPDAVSPTGVRGIMMLTRDTAQSLGIADREDPFESIIGGARYLLRVKNKIPERIPEPDRTWLALAAYNIGFGHLEDARIITEMRDGNPDRWAEVRANLPLLTQKKWYSRVKRGYARGWAPVHYVDNIRSYYEALVWLTSADFEDPVTADAGGRTSGRNAS
jgi:membrane-bound lytic murein transglycosylase F